MKLITLNEAKDRLSIDFNYKDGEIESRVNSIEGYLTIATNLDLSRLSKNSEMRAVAREYVFLSLWCDYYDAHTELNDKRLSRLIGQLQVIALAVQSAEQT